MIFIPNDLYSVVCEAFPRQSAREKYVKEELGYSSYKEFERATMAAKLGITFEQYKKELERLENEV